MSTTPDMHVDHACALVTRGRHRCGRPLTSMSTTFDTRVRALDMSVDPPRHPCRPASHGGRGAPSGRPPAMRIFHASSTKLIVTRVPVLDRERLDAIVAAIGDQLEGEWLLIGGALAALWFAPRRTTEDVDIVGLRG